jgi:hypothetical protein
VASWLNIARRRMVVPIYKKWEAQRVRVQIVSREAQHQLVAFFDGFSHAEAMNFSIKSMDVFEKIDKRGEWGLRLVDAKFALAGGKGEGREGKGAVKSRFACLDLLDYAGEHDDITIGFETKEGKLLIRSVLLLEKLANMLQQTEINSQTRCRRQRRWYGA